MKHLVYYRDFWRKHRQLRHVLIIATILLFTCAVSLAQTATPVPPTAVPPVIDIPTEDMIGNLNTWIAIFAPIMLFIGMIPVALGLLRYITRMFQSAFGGG